MNIIIVLENNPYFQSSASANRWLTLIGGLNKLGVKIELLIYGGYQSEKEAKSCKNENNVNGVSIKYIAPQLIQGYWKTRYYVYIGLSLRESHLIKIILKELEKTDGIVWTDSSHFGFNLAVQLKKHQPNHKLFLELSEFLDIHKYNKGNFIQRWRSNKRQRFFEEKAFHVYGGLALMTKTLYDHYTRFDEP